MIKGRILFADNDSDFLETRGEFLEEEEYELVYATNLTDARRALEQDNIGLAILDLRLRDDDDDHDRSGLILAREVARKVPKIILTGFPTWEIVREALSSQPDGLPAASDFVAKTEGPEALLRALRRIPAGEQVRSISRDEYNLDAVRALLQEAFTVEDLVRFCYYRSLFRPVLNRMEVNPSLNRLVDSLIEYCLTRGYLVELLIDVELERPRQYERYRGRLAPHCC